MLYTSLLNKLDTFSLSHFTLSLYQDQFYLSDFLKKHIYWLERERERMSTSKGRGRGRERISRRFSAEHRAWLGSGSHNLQIMTWAKTTSQKLNWEPPWCPTFIKVFMEKRYGGILCSLISSLFLSSRKLMVFNPEINYNA